MKIMVRAQSKDKWDKVSEHSYENESDLQQFLVKNPDLIPVDILGEGRKPIAVSIPEAGLPGSGHTDLIGLDEDGNIIIVETKLASNAEIKRKVIGQILEYGAYLWQKPYEEFDAMVQARRGRNLVQLIEEVEKEEDDWSSEEFMAAVSANLRDGNFALFIVVDEINEELRRIIDFLNTKTLEAFNLYALELKYFKAAAGEIVLPQVYGVSQERSSTRRLGLPLWENSSFRQSLETNVTDAKERAAFMELYEFLLANADQQKWGRGKDAGRVGFRMRHPRAKDGYVTLFRLKSDGGMKMGFGRIVRELPMREADEAGKQLLKSIGLAAVQKWYEEVYVVNGKPVRSSWPGSNRKVTEVLHTRRRWRGSSRASSTFGSSSPRSRERPETRPIQDRSSPVPDATTKIEPAHTKHKSSRRNS